VGGLIVAETFKRVCIKDYTIKDPDGTEFTIHRTREYITSREKDGEVRVFSTYWVWVPVEIFAGEVKFT
jgi:hypothetical protein